MPTNERCPVCMGRGTNTRGSLCRECNGIGEIPKRVAPDHKPAEDAQDGRRRHV